MIFDFHVMLFVIFLIGYASIIFEHQLKINKSALALLTGTLLWIYYLEFGSGTHSDKITVLLHHLSDISQILLFLIGAMTIVELIVSHEGFEPVKKAVMISNPRQLFWVLGLLGFWISSVLDNLTTILVLVSIIRNTVEDYKMRRLLCAGLVFVVNVGGAWTPIGDITTTMLWIAGRVNTVPLIHSIGLPSLIAMGVFATLYSMSLPKQKIALHPVKTDKRPKGSVLVLALGVAGFLAVPALKLLFNIPPFVGMLVSLGVIWIIMDRFHTVHGSAREFKIEYILTKIDISCVLFFLGVLLAVSCLEAAGILDWMARESVNYISNPYLFAMSIGILSSIVDNVPLVAGVINMFDVTVYPADHVFWMLNAYCAGVGGSLLIIGSAPGVALMSLMEVPFFWYFKRVGLYAFVAYLVGWGAIYLLN